MSPSSDVALDAVEHQVHQRQPVGVGHELHAVERLLALEVLLAALVKVEVVVRVLALT